jgi:type IV pilus assembly protein PilB
LARSHGVSQKVIDAALKRQRNDRRPLGRLLAEMAVPESSILAALADQLGLTPLDLSSVVVDPVCVLKVGPAFAREHAVLPLFADAEGILHVATSNVPGPELASLVATEVGATSVLELIGHDHLLAAFDRHLPVFERVDDAVQRAVSSTVQDLQTRADDLLVGDAPIVLIVNLLITQALRDRASDVHIEPQADKLRIRFRIDGALRDVRLLPRQLGRPIASRLKLLAEMDIVDRHRSQDGQTTMVLDGRAIDIRVSSMETIWGEKIVLRILDRSRSLVPLSDLGLDVTERDRVNRLAGFPYGLFVVSGPTGAGKTTTLYAALNELDRSTRNITTVEDPVEYQFAEINQIQINKLAGMTFANGLRAILRQDPDVILIGEVRDVETAQIAVQAALTGHLVLCSLHAADSVGAIYRFLDMGIEPFLVASALIGIVAQRLVRTVCTECSRPYKPAPEEIAFYKSVRGVRPDAKGLRAGAGCAHCGGTGLYDRSGVFECLEVSDGTRELIAARASHGQLREHATASGMKTLQEAACDRVDRGQTTLAQVMNTVYLI